MFETAELLATNAGGLVRVPAEREAEVQKACLCKRCKASPTKRCRSSSNVML